METGFKIPPPPKNLFTAEELARIERLRKQREATGTRFVGDELRKVRL